MNRNSILLILVITLFGFNFLSLVRIRNAHKNLNELQQTNKELISLANYNSGVMDTLFNSIYQTEITSDEFISSIVENQDFTKLLDSEKKVVFYFKEGHCMSCIYSVFLDLATIADDIGKENIIVATN